jgi:flagellar biosynthesis protein FliR
MITIEITDQATLVAFWLVFTRWLAILIQLPLFDNIAVPTVVKALTALLISYTFFPFLELQLKSEIAVIGIDNFWYMTIVNTIIGLVIGYFVKSIMNIFISAGSIITQQIGFAAVRYFDQSTSSQIGPFEQLMQWTMLVMVISSGALIPMFNGVFLSFFQITMIAPGSLAESPAFFLHFFKSIFIAGLMLASPLIFINVLIMSVLGIIARTVPQMNIIMVSFAVNIGMGLLVFAATSDEFFQVAFKFYTDKLGEWFQFIS